MKISVIIPAHNESASIGRLIKHLAKFGGSHLSEIIVSDCGSNDGTIDIAMLNGAIAVRACGKSRARQMNFGAYFASGDILYFVHADTLPPPTFATDILTAINEGHQSGCFSYRFDSDRKSLKFLSSFTRRETIFTGGGDQTLFVTRNVFDSIGEFDETLMLMEDFNMVERLRKRYSFHIIKKDALVSARKYEHNGFLRVQIANLSIFTLYKLGIPSRILKTLYRKMLYRYGQEEAKTVRLTNEDLVYELQEK